MTDLAERRWLRNIRVFGSVARGEDREGSDVDLLVDVDEGVGLVAIAGLARELIDLLGVPIDVVPADSLKRTRRAEALAEAVPLWPDVTIRASKTSSFPSGRSGHTSSGAVSTTDWSSTR